jgi:oligosaccharide repeat unit polymerase
MNGKFFFGALWFPFIILTLFDLFFNVNGVTNSSTFYIIITFYCFFLLGSYLADKKPFMVREKHYQINPKRALLIWKLLFITCIVGFILGVRAWKNLGVDIFSMSLDSYYQMNVIYRDEKRVVTGFVGRLYSLSLVFIIYTLFLYRIKVIKKHVAFTFIFIGIIFLFSPRRAMIFYSIILVFFYLVVFHYKFKVMNTMKLIAFGSIFVFIFGYSQYMLGKVSEFSIASTFDVFSHYTLSSIRVMDKLITTSHLEDVWILLSTPMRILSSLLDFNTNVDLSVPFVPTPRLSNTVPLPYYLYKSGEWTSIIIMSFILGFVSSYFIQRMKVVNSFWIFGVGLLSLLCILMSIREITFITYDFFFWVLIIFIIHFLLRVKLDV